MNTFWGQFKLISCCIHAYMSSCNYDNVILPSSSFLLDHQRCCYKVFLTFSPFFPALSLSLVALCQTVMARGESCLCPGPKEQLQRKPAKLTRSLWASHMHYSNQSILDHPDTLDIWVSVSSSPSPSVSPPPFFEFLLAFHLSGSLVLTAAFLQ